MDLICYLPPELAASHPLRRLILTGLPQFTRQVYESLPGLERRLTSPGEPDSILVLVAPDGQALEVLVAMGELCQTHPLVLILPEDQDRLQGLGHRLRPRFMTCLDCDPAEMEAVLIRLANRPQPCATVEGHCSPEEASSQPEKACATLGRGLGG